MTDLTPEQKQQGNAWMKLAEATNALEVGVTCCQKFDALHDALMSIDVLLRTDATIRAIIRDELRAAPTGVCEICGEVDRLVRRETEPPQKCDVCSAPLTGSSFSRNGHRYCSMSCMEAGEDVPPAPERDRRELEAKLERLQSAALWALGENGEFRARRDGEGAYWWRTEFRKRCGDALPTPSEGGGK